MRAVRALLTVTLMMTFAWTGFGAAQDTTTTAAEEEVTLEEGTTTTGAGSIAPGVPAGAQYARIKRGDSFAAVIWGKPGGTESDRHAVWVVSSWTRTFGAAQAEGPGGRESRVQPLEVRQFFIQRFDGIIEFKDNNSDGIANVVRSNRPIAPDEVRGSEPVFKGVSLRTAWTKTDGGKSEETVNGTTAKTWTLTLTATNLPYRAVRGQTANVGDGTLNKVEFTFHLKGWKEEGSATIPLYKVTVDREQRSGAVSRQGDRTVTGEFVKVNAKEDHLIEGWDFDASNDKPGLVLETHVAIGWAPASRAAAWIGKQLVEKDTNGGGEVSYTPENATTPTEVSTGNESLPDEDTAPSTSDRAQKLRDRRISFGGDWDKTGKLTWVSDTEVVVAPGGENTTGTVNFQVQGGRKFERAGPGGGMVRGVLLMGGFSYTNAVPFHSVMHDPETDVSMAEYDVSEGASDGEGRKRTPGFEAVFVLAASMVVVLAWRGRR